MYTIQEKLCYLHNVRQQQENGQSQRKTCHALNIANKQIIEWKKQLEMLKDCNNKKAMSLCKGKESLLVPYTDTLLSFIFELRETGMPVSTTMVLMKAAQIFCEFHEKTREAQVSITKWFVKVHRMVH